MRAVMAFLSGLLVGILWRPVRIDQRRRPRTIEPWRARRPDPPPRPR